MQELHNVKGSRKNGIYVDCKQLAIRLYKLSFTMAKRDAVFSEYVLRYIQGTQQQKAP